MALSCVVAVADNVGIDTSGVTIAFVPGHDYPASAHAELPLRISRSADATIRSC